MTKPPLERAARALCSLQGLPENTKFEGRPMWESFLPNARAVLSAMKVADSRMISAAVTKAEQIGPHDHVGIFAAMIDAALSE